MTDALSPFVISTPCLRMMLEQQLDSIRTQFYCLKHLAEIVRHLSVSQVSRDSIWRSLDEFQKALSGELTATKLREMRDSIKSLGVSANALMHPNTMQLARAAGYREVSDRKNEPEVQRRSDPNSEELSRYRRMRETATSIEGMCNGLSGQLLAAIAITEALAAEVKPQQHSY